MIKSTFLGIPHTGHDKTDEWVHKGKHWLEHNADKASDTLDEGANEIIEQAVAAVHAALATVGTDAHPVAAAYPAGAGRTRCAQPVSRDTDHPVYRIHPGHRAVAQHPR